MPASPLASASPCLLVVDTATEVVHLALVSQGQVRVRAVAGGAQASAATLPQMQALLAEAGLAWSQLDAIGFGQGPGAFTGLRTACAITQGLALALDRPVLALDTLMAVAESARRRQPALAQASSGEPALWVLQDARMQEVYAAPYRHTPQAGWRAEAQPALWPIAHARAQIAAGCVRRVAGSALGAYADSLPGLPLADTDPHAVPDGAALAALAVAAWQRGEQRDAALALPLYVRDKVAQTTDERTAARQAVAPAISGAAP
jgi:tRNA threonylcarbamoyladenosine biosynthesis protein TsaB